MFLNNPITVFNKPIVIHRPQQRRGYYPNGPVYGQDGYGFGNSNVIIETPQPYTRFNNCGCPYCDECDCDECQNLY